MSLLHVKCGEFDILCLKLHERVDSEVKDV